MNPSRTQRYILILAALGMAILVGGTLRLFLNDTSNVMARPDTVLRTGESQGSVPEPLPSTAAATREPSEVASDEAAEPRAKSKRIRAKLRGQLLVDAKTRHGDRVQVEIVVRDAGGKLEIARGSTSDAAATRAAPTTGSPQEPDHPGLARFELEPGDYLVAVEAKSLADEYQGPWFPAAEPLPGAEQGLFATPVTIVKGGVHSLTLRVLLKTVLYGHVIPPEGLPSTESTVVLQSWSQPTMPRTRYVGTDELGYYEAEVYPGRWGATLQLEPVEVSIGPTAATPERRAFLEQWVPESHPHHGHMKPFPAEVLVEEGTRTRLDLVYPNAKTTVRGRIVDQYGEPFEGLPVWGHLQPTGDGLGRDRYLMNEILQATESDEQGRFELQGFPPGAYQLRIAIDGYRVGSQPGENLLGEHVPLQLFEIGASGADVTLAEIVAQRSEPFEYQATIDWQRAPGYESHPFRSLTVQRTFHTGQRRDTSRTAPLQVNSEGILRWWCETPEDEVTLEIRTPDGKHKTLTIWPVPNERRFETISLQ